MNFTKTLLILTLLTLLILFSKTFAQENPPTAKVVNSNEYEVGEYKLINKIGNIEKVADQSPNGFSDFVNLLIKIAIAMAGALAVVIIIVHGVQYMGTDSVWGKSESKLKMGSAIGGLVLLLSSYLILYTINPDLVNIKIGISKVNEGEWEELKSTAFGSKKTNTKIKDITDSKEICDASWPDTGCSSLKETSACKTIFTFVDKLSLDTQGKKYIKAWAMEESNCKNAPTNYAGVAAYGIFQFTIPTAQGMSKGCNVVTSDINKSWLENSINTEKMVCMAKNLYEYNKKICGPNIYNTIAGLEGAGACKQSTNCNETFSCTQETHQQWSCLWDDNAHTIKNTGHVETRNAVQKIKYCMEVL